MPKSNKSLSANGSDAVPSMTDQEVIEWINFENPDGETVEERFPNAFATYTADHHTLYNAPRKGVVSASDVGGRQDIADLVNYFAMVSTFNNQKCTSHAEAFTLPNRMPTAYSFGSDQLDKLTVELLREGGDAPGNKVTRSEFVALLRKVPQGHALHDQIVSRMRQLLKAGPWFGRPVGGEKKDADDTAPRTSTLASLLKGGTSPAA